MKKLISLVLALAMILVVGAAFATGDTGETSPKNDSITIKNAKPGETYTIYKLFDLTVDNETDPAAYSYKINSGWEDFFAGDGAGYIAVTDGYVTEIKDVSGNTATNSRDLATAAAKYANKPAAVDTVTVAEGGNTAVFSGLADGYYLITSSLGSFSMADTTPSKEAVEINEKNDDNTVEKKVQEDSSEEYGAENDAQIGDTINFKTLAHIAARSLNVEIHDKMDSGFTYKIGSIKIFTDEGCTQEFTAYTKNEDPGDGETFVISINDSFAADATATQTLYITYSAVLNGNVVSSNAIVDQKNETYIKWGNGTSTKKAETTTTTHKFSVFKHATGSEEHLAGAVFQLFKGDSNTPLNLVKIDNNNYRIAMEGETGTVDSFETVASGDIVIWGVDTDDDYTMKETTPPEGYNELKDTVAVEVNAGNDSQIKVENKSGTELPSTGGIGTTIFYVVGGILLLGAAIVLVARRKANN